jgi:hypothetical protein
VGPGESITVERGMVEGRPSGKTNALDDYIRQLSLTLYNFVLSSSKNHQKHRASSSQTLDVSQYTCSYLIPERTESMTLTCDVYVPIPRHPS